MSRRKSRSKEEMQEALDIFERALAGDVDAIIYIWETYMEDEDNRGDADGNYQ